MANHTGFSPPDDPPGERSRSSPEEVPSRRGRGTSSTATTHAMSVVTRLRGSSLATGHASQDYDHNDLPLQLLLKRPTPRRAASVPAESPRLPADLASGMDPRLAKKKEKSRARAEQHRVAMAQGRIASWATMSPSTLSFGEDTKPGWQTKFLILSSQKSIWEV